MDRRRTRAGPRDEALTWANQVLRTHRDRIGILFTHRYLTSAGQRAERVADFPYETPGSVNDGESIWQAVAKRHDVRLTDA